MSLYNDLNEVLTPYANKIKELNGSLGEIILTNNLIPDDLGYTDGYYINISTGEPRLGNGYFVTDYVAVEGGVSYKSNKGRTIGWYDSDKAFIEGSNGTYIQHGITSPDDAAYIRLSVNKTTDGIETPKGLYLAPKDEYDPTLTFNGKVLYNYTTPWCKGLSINWIGDSIVDGTEFDDYVCEALGLTLLTTDGVDGGINGSTISLNGSGADGRNAICVRYADMSDDADIIVVSAGTNDFQYAWAPIGTIDSKETTTFYGALKTLCEGLINKYPQKLIFFTTPIKRAQPFTSGNGGEYTEDGVMTTPYSKNKYGLTLMDYCDIIKEVCGYYSIPVLDLNRESLLNPHLESQQDMFDDYYTHPLNAGKKMMARRVAGWIMQLWYFIE